MDVKWAVMVTSPSEKRAFSGALFLLLYTEIMVLLSMILRIPVFLGLLSVIIKNVPIWQEAAKPKDVSYRIQ